MTEVCATLLAGCLAAISTMVAVVYTNWHTKKQLKDQQAVFESIRKEDFKQSRYVLIDITLVLQTFNDFLDRLIVENDYNRVLLFSGEDGFEFYDDADKRMFQRARMLLIENSSIFGIKDIVVSTTTELTNLDNSAVWHYSTQNSASFLRKGEKIAIRVTNQEQFEKIIEMNKGHVQSLLNFYCHIQYSTLADQRISYVYEIEIRNDSRIEVKKDEVESIIDLKDAIDCKPTVFRNLQDTISGIDRKAYSWEKMGKAQAKGMINQISQDFSQGIGTNADQLINESSDKT